VTGHHLGLRFAILGPLLVEGDGGNADPPRSPVLRGLLGVLLLAEGSALPPERLAELVWADRAERVSRGAVQVAVSRLREWLAAQPIGTACPVTVESTSGGYRLSVDAHAVDLGRFRALCARARRTRDASTRSQLLTSALALVRGPVLADLNMLDRDADLLRSVESAIRDAALELADAAVAAGRAADGVAPLEAITTRQPLDEPLHARLIALLAACGRPSEALARYERIRSRLAEDFGISPSEEVQRAHLAVLAHDRDLSARGENEPPADLEARPVGCLLPPDVADFTGREEQVKLVEGLFAEDVAARATAPMIAAVAGKGGIGKTTLAVHVAHRLRDRFPDGQLYVNLGGAGAQPSDPAEVLDWLLRVLGVNGVAIPAGLEQRAALYRARLADRRVLVVLDNAASEWQVRPLLPGSPSCATLVTSRRRLAGLEGAHLVDLDLMTPGEATDLLGRIVGPERLAAEPAAAERIVALCGLLPLAVRVAGVRLATRPQRPLGWLADRLGDARCRLDELAAGDLEVRASLALSYQALDGRAQRAFSLLSLVRGRDFAPWAASVLLDVSLAEAESLLEGLVDAQLLEIAGHGPAGQTRYRFHDLLRVFAREQLDAVETPAGQRAALERLAGACLGIVERECKRPEAVSYAVLHGDGQRWPVDASVVEDLRRDPAAWFTAERGLLTGAVETACEAGLDELAWDLANSMAEIFQRNRYIDDWRHTHELALSAMRRAGNRRGEAAILRGLGMLSSYLDRQGTPMLEQAKAAFEEVGDDHGAALAEAGLGVHALWRRHYAEARGHLERALLTLTEAGDLRAQVYARRALGATLLAQGDASEALRCLEEGLATARRCDYPFGEGHIQRVLGQAHAELGHPDCARALFERSAELFSRLGQPVGHGSALHQLGSLHLRQGRTREGRAVLNRALRIHESVRDRTGKATVLQHLARVELAEGAPDRAIALLREALGVARAFDAPLIVAGILARLGDAYTAAGDVQAANAALWEALRLYEGEGQLEAPEAVALAAQLAEEAPR
jgi:DNA-binding SARP family transcriptional activator/tetratricopeptide (TPR) repeat protein